MISLLKGENYFIEEDTEIYLDFYTYFSKFQSLNTIPMTEKFDFNSLHLDEAIKIKDENIIQYLSINGCGKIKSNWVFNFFGKHS